MPVAETDTAYWFSPGIDRDLIQSWWCTENEYYFCYPPVDGVYPNKGQLVARPAAWTSGSGRSPA